MYDWKELALMYKSEAFRLNDEMDVCLQMLEKNLPKCGLKSKEILDKAIKDSLVQMSFLNSFEGCAQLLEPPKSRGTGITRVVYFEGMSPEQVDLIEGYCEDIHDHAKRAYVVVDKCALHCSHEWLIMDKKINNHSYEILPPDLKNNKDNVIKVVLKSGQEKEIKVVASGMKFSGKTRKFGSTGESTQVPLQHTYLIDPKEPIKDAYIFTNVDRKKRSSVIYARVSGKLIHDMTFEPLRERFIGKKACILEQTSYNKLRDYPCSINEMINRRQ